MSSSTPQFSFDNQFNLKLTTAERTKKWMGGGSDWLSVAEKSIWQDLETSKKEFRLIRDILDELGVSLEVEGPSYKSRGQMFLMRACQEYSASRCHMLEERLRQLHIWLRNEQMGGEIPKGMPNEWFMVDTEWRQWLSEQVALQADESNRKPTEHFQSREIIGLVRLWGPLFPILTIHAE